LSGTISVPIWLAISLLVLTLWAALDRLFIPSVRWFLRRRTNIVIDSVNRHLNLQLRPFQLTRRRVLIDRLVYDAHVVDAANEHAAEQGMPREVVMSEIRRYAKEIVPAFNAYVYFRVGYWIAKRAAQLLYRVRVGYTNDEALSAVDRRATVVFVMNAVGEWARVFPLQTLIKWMGGYFVRRRSRNPLYRRVLARYVRMATAEGVVQAVFPEGGLTKDGALLPPRLGILDYMLRGFDANADRDVVFVPVGINYDRVLEDRTQLRHVVEGGEDETATPVRTTFRFALSQIGLMLRGRWHRLGYACVNFGTPLSMREWAGARDLDFREISREQRFEEIAKLAEELMQSLGGIIPVVPVAVVATLFADEPGRSWSGLELKASAHALQDRLTHAGAHVYVPRADQDYAIDVGLRMLTLRRLVTEENGLYRANADELATLRYYANSIAHLRPSVAGNTRN
jgi:glycerol-3-phosphate O-acyltransferase